MEDYDTLLQVLKFGLQLEKRGMSFYSKSSTMIEDPVGKQTLTFLATEEERHYKFIKGIFEDITSTKGKDISVSLDTLHEPTLFPPLPGYITRVRASETDIEILSQAEKLEIESRDYYLKKVREVEGRKAKRILEILAREEEKHYNWIKYLKDHVSGDGYWMGIDSYFSLDGA